ncbi:hypothetical protein GRI97_01090 [Altererythrobacter xixiisoli]|uniref:Lipoprotein n=1 Tax=Croceibacterium xixiisoli TaxID=1476466 RepID=A0A6I4TNV8_9SPHN|nr:hypothetical protein [Croceibacterium xixiisoli]MXO97582.1 hypothetical protein [Croceibacterium xixiisoli]
MKPVTSIQGRARRLAMIAAAGLAVVAAPALACDQHDEAVYKFLGFLNYGGMTPEQKAEATQRAIDEFHADQIARSKQQFLRRFTPDAQEPIVTASRES